MRGDARELAALATTYDDYNRSWPKVFVGEFAANLPVDGVVHTSLRAAVAVGGKGAARGGGGRCRS